MNFFSHIELPKSSIKITYHDLNMLFGSCFAENIGHKLIESKFRTDLNPFGILYNPASIALSIRRLMDHKKWENEELFFSDGLYHSFGHHSCFSDVSPEACLHKINERLIISAGNLRKTSKLFITFGTAYVFRLQETGQVVANCHKLPAKLFIRERLTVQQIVTLWEKLLTDLSGMNKELTIFFTVSPVRYWQDGVHENQLSKSILLLAVEQLNALFPGRSVYFPAYELMMDELRDYRFYAEDLCHPSNTAIQYIWERLTETWMDELTQRLMKEIDEIKKALNHKPFNQRNDAYKHFLSQLLLQIEQLNEKMPYICFAEEVLALRNQIKP